MSDSVDSCEEGRFSRNSNAVKLFKRLLGDENVGIDGKSINVVTHNDDDREIVLYIAHQLYMTPSKEYIEGSNDIKLVDIIPDIDDDNNAEEFTDYEADDGELLDDGECIEDELEDHVPSRRIPVIDERGRVLQVLTTRQMHNFAKNLYNTMRGNEDLSLYLSFLGDLDRFLTRYLSFSSIFDEIDPDTHDDTDVKNIERGLIDESCTLSLRELRVLRFVREFAFFEHGELVKRRSIRSRFLALFGDALASEAGSKLLSAFSDGNREAFSSAFEDICQMILNEIPYDNSGRSRRNSQI
jgi:hypothetical protein